MTFISKVSEEKLSSCTVRVKAFPVKLFDDVQVAFVEDGGNIVSDIGRGPVNTLGSLWIRYWKGMCVVCGLQSSKLSRIAKRMKRSMIMIRMATVVSDRPLQEGACTASCVRNCKIKASIQPHDVPVRASPKFYSYPFGAMPLLVDRWSANEKKCRVP